MRVPLIQSQKQFKYDEAANYRNNKENDGLYNDHARMRIRGPESDNKSKYDNADDIIYDGGADNRRAYLTFDFT